MKRIFSVEIGDDETDEAFMDHVHGPLYRLVLYEMSQWLRNKTKYEDVEKIDVDEVREKLRELQESLIGSVVEI